MACEDDMLFDLRYDGCNFASQTDCGERFERTIQTDIKQSIFNQKLYESEICLEIPIFEEKSIPCCYQANLWTL